MFQFSDRTAARVNAIPAALTGGFTTKSAKKDATDTLNRAMEEIGRALSDAVSEAAGRPWIAENRSPTEAEWSRYIEFTYRDGRDLPMYLNQFRPKHMAAIAEFLPAAVEPMARLVSFYDQVKNAEVRPVETKAAKARKEKAAILEAGSHNVIIAAVAPLKADAIARAEKDARELVAKVAAKLEAAGWDLNVAAPSSDRRRDDERTQAIKDGRRSLYHSVTKSRPDQSYRLDAPYLVDMDPALVDRFIENAKRDAALQYDEFVAKLAIKVGKGATAATLEGNHVWGDSYLSVTMPGGIGQRWHTQQIVNVSKLGKLFNQWPTRRVL